MATLPYEQRVTLNDASKAYYGNGQPSVPQRVTLHDASRAAYPHVNFLDWFLTGDTGNSILGHTNIFKRSPNVPSVIPSYIPQDQADTDSRLPSHIPQVNPHAELPYLLTEAENSPYKLSPSGQAVLKPAIPSDEEIVNDIIRNNKYGTGATRRQNLLNLGLTNDDYERIRGLVNARMYANRAAVRPRAPAPIPAPVPVPQPRQRKYYQGMPFNNGDVSVEDIM